MSKDNKSFSELADQIKKTVELATANLKKFGMTDKAIDKFFDGEEVIDCPYCNTPNMIEVHYNEEGEWSMYECLSCSKTYMRNWKEE